MRAWDPDERLLLVAAIGDPGDAEAAYTRWRQQVDLDAIRGAAVRVLPLLTERAAAGDDHPVSRKVAQVARFSWLKSQLLLTRTLPAVQKVLDLGIPVMATKGAAVVHHSHGQLHRRPMDDLDVAVPRARAAEAAWILMTAGLDVSSLPADPRDAAIFDQVHALPFRDAGTGAELDLHWQVVHGSLHPRASDDLWARAVPGHLREVPVHVLSREDTVVQVIAHGLTWNLERPVQWAADVGLLLRDAHVDWELVAETAQRHRVGGIVGEGLAAVRELAPSLVPGELPEALGRRRWPGPAHWHEHVRRTVEPGRRPGPRTVLGYARESGRLPAPQRTLVPSATVGPGGRLTFSTHGNGVALLTRGWWAPDSFGTWSRGREAALTLALDGACGPLAELQVTLVPLLGGRLPQRTVDVRVDGERVARWRFASRDEHTRVLEVPVPPQGRVVEVRLSFASREAPAELGVLADHRPTAIALRSLIVGRVVARPPWDPAIDSA